MMKYSSSTVSIRNRKDQQKPNEDYYLADDEKGIYILVDGVSRDKSGGIYPNPSPARIVSELFVNCVYQVLAEAEAPSMPAALREAVEAGNKTIRDYNAQTHWENDFLPGTVGIAAVLRNGNLHYAYIGDCFGMVLNRGKHIFTRCQTEEIVKHKKEFTSYEIRNLICNHIDHPYSYGVWNGDGGALDFVGYGEISLSGEDQILLCSDGFSDVIMKFCGEELCGMTLEQMIAESASPDDKTMILVSQQPARETV